MLHLQNLKSLTTILQYATLTQSDFVKLVENDFRGSHLHNLKSLSTISLYTTLAQPIIHYIRIAWFLSSTLAQPEILIFIIKTHISCYYTRTTWFSLDLQKMFSVANQSCCVCVCFLTYTYFVLIYV